LLLFSHSENYTKLAFVVVMHKIYLAMLFRARPLACCARGQLSQFVLPSVTPLLCSLFQSVGTP